MTTGTERSQIVADVARAGSVVAPYWPLTSFVAVNPLGGLAHLHFDVATQKASHLHGSTVSLSLQEFRAEYERGTITDVDLDRAVLRRFPDLADTSVELGGTTVGAVELLRWDLLHGPTPAPAPPGRPTIDDDLDRLVETWCAAYVDEAHVPWAMPRRDEGFYASWRAVARSDRRLRSLAGSGARRRIDALPADPVEMIDLALSTRGIDESGREVAIRTLLLRTPGWAGFARWCDDWAPAGRPGVRLRMLDLAAVRAALGHLVAAPLDLAAPTSPSTSLAPARAAAVAEALGVGAVADDQRAAVVRILERVDEAARTASWLSAHEWNLRDRLLTRLQPGPMSRPDTRPDAQLVFCIDVRSEGFRRRLEALGDYDTYGFAGFFGVPVRWRPIGSDVAEARCPVLVSPRHEVAEVAVDDDADYLASCATSAGLHDAFYAAKGGVASPFALAETAGWFAGPVAAARTLLPGRRTSTGPWWQRDAPTSAPIVDATGSGSGLSLEERTLFAEAIVTTIGMSRFAPIIVLSGHGSHTVNNPHASSLDCGACGGAPGGASARIAAAILNDAEVRAGLVERGIEIPDDTVVVAAEHDTTADVVTILDEHLIPGTHRDRVAALCADLEEAGARNAADRAGRLPGRTDRVRDRGHDWAQVRPEWGLAGNAAFIVGPRAITAEHDLRGRAFLHSYEADRDPDGVALETIMTAPLVVAQWISAQYYFSTVDNDVYGAGDKMLHNPVGGIGVVVGESGDLAVGLPLQSVMLGDQRAHDPLRLMAVIQAPLDRIDGIIHRNPGVRDLVDGEWIHVVARATSTDEWSYREPGGGFVPWHGAEAATPSEFPAAPSDPSDLATPLDIR